MNTAHLEVDVEMVSNPPTYCGGFGDNAIVRDARHDMIFIMTYRENGLRVWRRSWRVWLRDSDFDNEEVLIRKITTHLKERPEIDIWDTQRIASDSEGWQPFVEISSRAQEIFALLRNPGQKWLTQFAK